MTERLSGNVPERDSCEDAGASQHGPLSRLVWFGWILAVLLPPVGLIWAWAAGSIRLWHRIALTAAAVFFGWLYAYYVFGLHVGFLGDMRPVVEFRGPRWPVSRDAVLSRPKVAVKIDVEKARRLIGNSVEAVWPGFMGPGRDGVVELSQQRMLPWPAEGLQELWRREVGGGYASVAAAYGRLYTIEQRGEYEVASCYELATGRELWHYGYRARFSEWQGGPGPRATPAVAQGRLYTLGALGHLHCFDARSGKLIWRTNILEDAGAQVPQWGVACSPLVYGKMLITTPGGSSAGISGYELTTGRLIWQACRRRTSYSSPVVLRFLGRQQLLYFNADSICSHDIESGEELWSYPWATAPEVNVAQPVLIRPSRILISAAYGMGTALLRIGRLESDPGKFLVKPVWRRRELGIKFASPIVYEGSVYGLDGSVLRCLGLAKGNVRWSGRRYGYGQIMRMGEWIVVLSERGELAQVRASPDRFEEVARFKALNGKTWNHPAVAGELLIVRNANEMACFRLPIVAAVPTAQTTPTVAASQTGRTSATAQAQ